MGFAELLVCATVLAVGVLAGQPKFDGPSDVTLELYTQGNPTKAEYISLDDGLTSPSFNPKNPTRVVIHGWISNARNLEGYRDAYLATGQELNIVLVDWSGPSNQEVPEAAASAVLVGDYVGQVLNHLIATRGLNPDDLVIVGHSMGGHVAGVVGNRVGGGAAAEVIALDPANGLFDNNTMEDQLDASDAKFVQVMHTDNGGYGAVESRGHADFFPNGGSHQTGCPELAQEKDGCSHNRAPLYFIESITSKKFIATACSNYDDYIQGLCSANKHVLMGEWTPTNISGSYFLETNGQSPFAQGKTEL